MCLTPNSGSQPHLQRYHCHGIQIGCLNTLNLLFFFVFVCVHSTLCEVWQLISKLPSLSVGSGLSESQQLKPNVITVSVKGLDKRLRMGMAPCAWYSRDTIVRTSLTAACPLSWISSPWARGESNGIARLLFLCRGPPPIMTSLSPHSWRGQGAGRRGVKDRSAKPHLFEPRPLCASESCLTF